MKRHLSFILLVGTCITSASFINKTLPSETQLFYNGNYDAQMEVLHGAIKSISIGDSSSIDNYYHADVDRKGNMVKSFEKDKFYGDVYRITAFYKVVNNSKGIKTSMSATYDIKPAGICECFGKSAKWKFDGLGRMVEFMPKRRSGVTEYEYDNLSRVQYQKAWGKKDVPQVTAYKYDEYNRPIELQIYEPEWQSGNWKGPGRVREMQNRVIINYLTFDSHNNWIRKQRKLQYIHENGESSDMKTDTITRTITYY